MINYILCLINIVKWYWNEMTSLCVFLGVLTLSVVSCFFCLRGMLVRARRKWDMLEEEWDKEEGAKK